MNRDFLITLKRMNTLIKMKATGKPKQFARKLGVSQSSLYNYIKRLKSDFGAPIDYDADMESYFFIEDGGVVLGFQSMKKEEEKVTIGGMNYNHLNFSSVFSSLQIF